MATSLRSPAQGLTQAEYEKMIPNRGFVVLKREDQQTVEGAILLVPQSEDDRRKRPTVARVVKIGNPDRTEKTDAPIPFQVKVGDRVIVDAFAGHDIEITDTGERLVMMGECEMHAIIDDGVSFKN